MSNSLIKIIGKSLNTISYISPKYASKKALYLFAEPRQRRVINDQKSFLDSAESLYLKHKHLNIATYLWKGNGKTVLLAHGWESNSGRWQNLISKLQKLEYNIVSLDAPAHGNTSGKQFNAILYSECINVVAKHYNPHIIIGHSVGGMASGFYQKNYENKELEKLVFLGAPSEFTGVFKNYVDMMGYNNKIENGINSLVLERFNKLPSYFSLADFSKAIDTKTLIVHDVFDKVIPFSDAQKIAKNHKNATFISTKGFGHGLRNETVYKHVIDFIQS